jgi:hypothetical protein
MNNNRRRNDEPWLMDTRNDGDWIVFVMGDGIQDVSYS